MADITSTAPDYAPDADTWDHVVRAVAHTRHAGAAAVLMRATREHAHDAELLWLTRAVRSGMWGETLLVCAARRYDVARVAEILAACPTPAARAELLACGDVKVGWTALHWACNPCDEGFEKAALELVELLLGAGADPLAHARNLGSAFDFQPIHRAARWSARLVQRLVLAGASIDGDLADSSTLCAAASAYTAHSVRMIPALVALGARETHGNRAVWVLANNHPSEGTPPSDSEVLAALNALVSVGCSLAESDEDEDDDDDDGGSPLDLAVNAGNTPVVRALLSLNAPATMTSYQNALTALLNAGCDLDEPYAAQGMTHLDSAASEGNTPLVRALLAVGATTTTKSLAHAACHPDALRALLKAGAPAGALVQLWSDAAPITPLMCAAFSASEESVRILLAATVGAHVNCRDMHGLTALAYALDAENNEAFVADSDDEVLGVVRALLEAGADVTTRDARGDTPLHCLAKAYPTPTWAVDAAKLLLDSGADPTATNRAGDTPAQVQRVVPSGVRERRGELHRMLMAAASHRQMAAASQQ